MLEYVLKPTSTKQSRLNFLLKETTRAFDWVETHTCLQCHAPSTNREQNFDILII